MTIDDIRALLVADAQAHRVHLVAAESGVPLSTVRKIQYGTIKHSRTDTFAKLVAYYEGRQQ